MNPAIETVIVAAHKQVRQIEDELETAKTHRTLAFALANEKGATSGDIARATGITPMQALHMVRTGHRLIQTRRAQADRRRTTAERQAA